MLRKDSSIKWTLEAKQSFEAIKEALTKTPVLIRPDFSKDFISFSFASKYTIAVVLLQKNNQGYEQRIAFFSKSLRYVTLKYNIMEKQALVLVKAIKDFRVYILYSHIIAYVPNSVVKDILTQNGHEGKRGKWIATILEYDIEIKPTKLIKGQGLAKLMAESNSQALEINFLSALDDQEEMATPQIGETFTESSCGILLTCLLKDEADKILQEFHAGDYRGHLYWKSTADKILSASFYWPTLLADVKKHVTSCHKCQIFEGKKKLLPFPLKPISIEMPFQQWGLDFIGEIHLPSSVQHKWILTTTNYFTKWIEAIPSKQVVGIAIITFLESNILSRFGCPKKLITDNATTFKSKRMIDFCNKYHITLGHSTTYYPQGNGLEESSSKSLVNIIKKLLEDNKKTWHKKLVNALWIDRLTTKKSIGTSPYQLIYGMDAVFPSSVGVRVMKILQEL
eukprot:PITA_17162